MALLLGLFALAVLMHLARLHVDPLLPSNLPFYAAGILAVALRFALPRTNWRHAAPVAHFSEYAVLFMVISLMGATASYPVAALTHGYADTMLQHVDEALGFDWLGWYRLVAAYPVLQALGTVVYRSIYVTPALLLWSAARAGDHVRAYRFLAGFCVAAVITLAVFSLMPAVGPFSYLWHGPIPYMPESELWQQGLIPALRAHEVHIVDLGHLRGIVSAPSFHTAAAVLYVVAAWRIPTLRWPIVALNAAMLLSTPVEGTHYLIDMILGAIVAILSLGVIRLYFRALEPRGDGEAVYPARLAEIAA
ncbi:phosphatase PAP2 family protein [Novosphingobium sp. BL-8H]|uniref:phosphatase PAP2 family protein n=1 Tax=Novosphingobium sp. BL-8H TaxID=3127640 RepID=UPI0037569ECD